LVSIQCSELDKVWFAVAVDEKRVIAASFSTVSRSEAFDSCKRSLRSGCEIRDKETPLGGSVIRSLAEIYRGGDMDEEIPIQLSGLPPFEKRVLEQVRKIPKGRVATYASTASRAGSPRAWRAVGNAMAKNPFVLIVPCHRVIRSTMETGNYGRRPEIKRELLEREGVAFRRNRVLPECLWR